MDGFIAVGAFQKDDAEHPGALFVLVVEEQILVETEEARLPFAAVQRPALQIAARSELFDRLITECVELNIVHTKTTFLHAEHRLPVVRLPICVRLCWCDGWSGMLNEHVPTS